MKVVIFAGGFGTRISEESEKIPKPMVDIGERPILWHILKIYSYYGFNDFIICLGYKGYKFKEYFSNYYMHMSDITFDFRDNNSCTVHSNVAEPWKITLVDTGLHSNTAQRLLNVQRYLEDKPFMLTYGDGVSDLDIHKLLDHHRRSNKTATLTAIQPGGRFGSLHMEDGGDGVLGFEEKTREDGGWVNGGFMVMNPNVFDYLNPKTMLEVDTMRNLSAAGELSAYRHTGFWQCMDTLRDKNLLEDLWSRGAPWKKW